MGGARGRWGIRGWWAAPGGGPSAGPAMAGLGMVALVLAVAQPVTGQELADFDYENLSFRGIGLEAGYMNASRVTSAPSLGVRADLGYLGPGVRVVAGLSRWSSTLKRDEVARLEQQVSALIEEQTGEFHEVSLGEITWSDVAISVDGHFVWAVPFGVLTYAGLGATAHVMNGGGRAIEDTFVEDLLDSVRAGVNIHAGLELPLDERFRVYGVTRFEVLENLNYLEFRVGGQLLWGGTVPGEEGRR